MSAVPKEKLPEILREMDETKAWGLSRFSDSEYLERRVVIEQKIRDAFIAKGGKPVLKFPIYFFLGRNNQFEKYEANKGYVIRLSDLPTDAVSFTYGDSMFSLNKDYRNEKGEGYLSDLCPHVYRLEDLPGLFSHADLQSRNRLHIEAQLWITPSDAVFSRCD